MMAITKGLVSIKETGTIDNRTQPGTSGIEYKVISNETGRVIAGGSGETKEEARQNLRGAIMAEGWMGDEIDELLTQYDAAT